jgi:bifunctional ADP-heptose synthase (sugar kinase/adenylyltransferase)
MKIAVIGDSCKDVFIYGICNRLNPEAPVPIIFETYRTENYGMAGNVYKNLLSLGIESELITNKEEIIKTRFVEKKSNYILLRFDKDVSIEHINTSIIQTYDAIIISDYNKGFLTIEDIKFITENNKLTFVDTKKALGNWILGASYVKINEGEFSSAINDAKTIEILLNKNKLIITLGDRGVLYKDKIYASKNLVNVRDVVGAGDTFLAALAGHYIIHKNIEDAIDFANLCAGQVVSKKGIAYPDEKLI